MYIPEEMEKYMVALTAENLANLIGKGNDD